MNQRLDELKGLCTKRGINSFSRGKLPLVARLFPYISDCTDLEELEQHEIITMCHVLGITGMSFEEKFNNLKCFAKSKGNSEHDTYQDDVNEDVTQTVNEE